MLDKEEQSGVEGRYEKKTKNKHRAFAIAYRPQHWSWCKNTLVLSLFAFVTLCSNCLYVNHQKHEKRGMVFNIFIKMK